VGVCPPWGVDDSDRDCVAGIPARFFFQFGKRIVVWLPKIRN